MRFVLGEFVSRRWVVLCQVARQCWLSACRMTTALSANSLDLASTALHELDRCVIRYRAGGAFAYYRGEVVTLLQCGHKRQ